MDDNDTRSRNRRIENMRVWEEFRKNNPHATLDDLRGMADKLSDGQNYFRGGLPAEQMLGRIADENAAKLADEQLQREMTGYQADAQREAYIDQLLKDKLLSNDDTSAIAAEAVKNLNPTLRGYWDEKYLPRLDRKRDDLARAEARTAATDFMAMAPGARDMAAAEPMLSKLSPRSAEIARQAIQAHVAKNAQDWELREFDKRMRIADMAERRAERERAAREREEERRMSRELAATTAVLNSPAAKLLTDPSTAALPPDQKAQALKGVIDLVNSQYQTKITPDQIISATSMTGPLGVVANQQAWQEARSKSFDQQWAKDVKFGEEYLTKGAASILEGATTDPQARSAALSVAAGFGQTAPHMASQIVPAIQDALRQGKKTPKDIQAYVLQNVKDLTPASDAYRTELNARMKLPPPFATPEVEKRLSWLNETAATLDTVDRLAQQPPNVALALMRGSVEGFKEPEKATPSEFLESFKNKLRAEIRTAEAELQSYREHAAGSRVIVDENKLAKAMEAVNALKGRLDALTYTGATGSYPEPAPVTSQDFGVPRNTVSTLPMMGGLPSAAGNPLAQAATRAQMRMGDLQPRDTAGAAKVLAEEAARVGVSPQQLAAFLRGQ
ncbi:MULTISPECIES: hypothetical protein [unclassified Azospirillum]|uniref:hypothetical protein n=1 Tax=unclassified Azospirillum TaxID=2630922 RepID=UPI0011B22BEC|nr:MULTISPECIES: hypothetical protein [unclassified Azospirillum]